MRLRALVLSILVIAFASDTLAVAVAGGAVAVARPLAALPSAAVATLEALADAHHGPTPRTPAQSPRPSSAVPPAPPLGATPSSVPSSWPAGIQPPPMSCALSGLPSPFSLADLAMVRLLLRETQRTGGCDALLLAARPLGGRARATPPRPSPSRLRGIVPKRGDPPG